MLQPQQVTGSMTVQQIDINSIMNMMILLVVVVMMMKMMGKALSGGEKSPRGDYRELPMYRSFSEVHTAVERGSKEDKETLSLVACLFKETEPSRRRDLVNKIDARLRQRGVIEPPLSESEIQKIGLAEGFYESAALTLFMPKERISELLKASPSGHSSSHSGNPIYEVDPRDINSMIDKENPEALTRCVCCGKLIPEEESGKTKIWFDTWLGNIVWACPKCDEWLGEQKDPDLAFHLAVIRRWRSGTGR